MISRVLFVFWTLVIGCLHSCRARADDSSFKIVTQPAPSPIIKIDSTGQVLNVASSQFREIRVNGLVIWRRKRGHHHEVP